MQNKRNFTPHIKRYLDKGIRYDGRKLDEYREITIEKGVTQTAEGSARVKIGNTEVIAGVKMDVGTPFPDTPDEGAIMVGAEFLPIASNDFEAGPPGEDSVELARVVDRGIRESGAMDLKKLSIVKGKQMWMVSVDVCTMNDEGNLLDAAGLAAIAAIEDAVFPELEKLEEDKYQVDYKKKSKNKITMVKKPIPVTVYKLGESLFVDPIREEVEKSEARITVTSTEDGKICALQKGGEGVFTIDELSKAMDLALTKSKELRSKL